MKIEDLKEKLNTGNPVYIQIKFDSYSDEEPYSTGFIARVSHVEKEIEDGDDICWEVSTMIPNFLIPYNKERAIRNWIDKESGKYELDYFEFNTQKKKVDGYVDSLFVMGKQDWFEFVPEEKIEQIRQKYLNDFDLNLVDYLREKIEQLEKRLLRIEETVSENI